MKRSNIAITSLFCLYIGSFFVLNLITEDVAFSNQENRILGQKPEFTFESLISGEFTAKYETYVTDQFIFRDQFVEIKSISERFLGKKENNSVYISKENTLIDKYKQPDYSKIDINLKYIDSFAQAVDIPVHFALIPTQNDIYAHKLPDNAPIYSQKEVINHSYDALSNNNNLFAINVYGALLDKKDEYIYFNTDHHWTTLGAYYAYDETIKSLGKVPTPLTSFTKQTISTTFNGTIYSSSGVRYVSPDTIDIYTPNQKIDILDVSGLREDDLYNMSKLDNKDQYEVFLGGNDPLVTINGNGTGKILIIKDSYSNSQAPFFIENYEEIHLIDMRFYRIPMSQYIKDNNIDNVLIAYSMPNFTTDTNLVFLK